MIELSASTQENLAEFARELDQALLQDPSLNSSQLAFWSLLERICNEGVLDVAIEIVRDSAVAFVPAQWDTKTYQFALPQCKNNALAQRWTQYWDTCGGHSGSLESKLGAPSLLHCSWSPRTDHPLIIPLPVRVRLWEDRQKRQAFDRQSALDRALPTTCVESQHQRM